MKTLFCLLGFFLVSSEARAQIEWRVSVKFILDGQGQRPSFGNFRTDGHVNAELQAANIVLDRTGRGYRLNVVEIRNLTGLANWSNIGCVRADRNALDSAAKSNPQAFLWRSDAINVYITHAQCGGICSFPEEGRDAIIIGQAAPDGVLLHEIGHYMGLCHTQGCPCGGCGGGVGECNSPGDDGIGDTLLDLPCWTQNDISMRTFGVGYMALTEGQKQLVDDVFKNVMSYHDDLERLTEGQMDLATDVSNGARFNAATARTIFVDGASEAVQTGSSTAPFRTISGGIQAANPGDLLLVRENTYVEGHYTFSKRIHIRSRGGGITVR